MEDLNSTSFIWQLSCSRRIDPDLKWYEETVMAVARLTKVTASSAQGFQQAAEEGLKRATKTLRGVTGFEVIPLKAL